MRANKRSMVSLTVTGRWEIGWSDNWVQYLCCAVSLFLDQGAMYLSSKAKLGRLSMLLSKI